MNDILQQKIKLLPNTPGVYVMLNEDKQVIYVGKAKILKNRVKQYFHNSVKTDKVMAMVSNISDFYYVITKTEYDALSLENNLIKKYKPKYNILLKDDKTYPYIKVNLNDEYPHFEIVRRIKKDGAKYFGPFMLGVSVKDILEILSQCYKIRNCSNSVFTANKKRECLEYHIGRCNAPCTGKISHDEYMKTVHRAIDFLNGNDDDAYNILSKKMQNFSDKGEFELAISVREKIKMLNKISEKKITSLQKDINADIVAIATNGIYSAINVLFMRGGRMQGSKSFSTDAISLEISDTISSFLRSYYNDGVELPNEIILSDDCADSKLIEQYYKEYYSKSVNIITPKQGLRRQLAEMGIGNANDYLEKTIGVIEHKKDMTVTAAERLKQILNLKRFPKRIECYDISNISGVDKVGSMVVFTDGDKDIKEYRRFTIKTVEGANDFASLKEVLTRRLDKLSSKDYDKFPMPDLIVIDGGKGQLSAVKEVFDKYNYDIDLISLAKRDEEIFTIYSNEPIVLSKRDFCLKMLQSIRDEAHRFAITFFRSKHNKRNLYSELDAIKGIGKEKKKALLKHFGGISKIKTAEISELEKVVGFGKVNAKTVYDFFRGNNGN